MSAILPLVMARLADVAEVFEDRQLVLLADAQGLVELAAGTQDVGDLAPSDGGLADVAEVLGDRQLILLADAQGLVVARRVVQDVGDLALAMALSRTSPRRS